MRVGGRVQRKRWVVCLHTGQDDIWESRPNENRCNKCVCMEGLVENLYGSVGTLIDIEDDGQYPTAYTVRWDDNTITRHDNKESDDPNKVYMEDLEDVTPRVYVNVYIHDRQYGGPEEGGWWYDVYEPVPEECVLADSEEDAVRIAEEKEEWADSENEGRRPPHSVLSEGHYVVRIEAWPAEFTPRTRPYYC